MLSIGRLVRNQKEFLLFELKNSNLKGSLGTFEIG